MNFKKLYIMILNLGELKSIYILEVENGINNGTCLKDSSWGDNLKSYTKEVEVLKDIVFDENELISGI